MYRFVSELLDRTFQISQKGSSLTQETSLALKQSGYVVILILISSHVLSSMELPLLTSAQIACVIYGISSILISLLSHYPFVLMPNLPSLLAIHLLFFQTLSLSWITISQQMFIASFSLWLMISLGWLEILNSLIPRSLKRSFFVGCWLLVILASLRESKLLEPQSNGISLLGELTLSSLFSLIGLILGSFLVRKSSMQFMLIFSIFFYGAYSFSLSKPSLDLPSFNSYTTNLQNGTLFGFKLLSGTSPFTIANLPNVLSFILILIFSFSHLLFLWISRQKILNARSLKLLEKPFFINQISFLNCLTALSGLGWSTSSETRFSHQYPISLSSFPSLLSGFLILTSAFVMPWLTQIPSFILVIPLMIDSFWLCQISLREILQNQEGTLVPSFFLISLLPLTFNLAIVISLAWLVYSLQILQKRKGFQEKGCFWLLMLLALSIQIATRAKVLL